MEEKRTQTVPNEGGNKPSPTNPQPVKTGDRQGNHDGDQSSPGEQKNG